MLNPGSTTWSQAVPAFLVAAALLFVPGTVAGLLARLRPQSALVVGPVLSTSALAVTGIVAPKIGVQWGAATFAAGIVVLWAAAALVGFAESRWAPRWAWLRPAVATDRDGLRDVDGARTPDAHRADARSAGARDGRSSRWVARLDSPGWATVAGVAFALAVVAYSLVRISKTPEAFPQHPDTIFHLADAQWMVEHHDISSLTAAGYITPSGTGFYPAAFHGFTATISMLTGVPVVVATSVFVLAAAGIAWPLGCIALATTLFGRRTPVVLATGVTCVAFTGYPYFLMGFGVLWPNLFGETLLPSYLAAFLALVGSRALVRNPLAPRFTAAAILLIGLPGLTLAHPNALMSFGVFALVILAGAALRTAWRLRRRPLPALGVLGGTVLVLGLVFLGSRTVAPGGMLRTGAIGPELKVPAALNDLVFFAPRGASYLPVLTGVVAVGIIALLVRRRAPRWVLAAMVVMFGLYWANVTIDDWAWRDLTWPWYNNAVRLQAVAILPTVMVAVAGLVAVVDLLALPFRRRAGARAGTGAGTGAGAGAGATLLSTAVVIAAFGLGTHAYVTAHDEIIDRYFHPPAANSWASDAELRALHTLGKRLPGDAVVAANPWNGGTYLYVVSGRHLLVPTEKANAAGDRQLLSLRLDEVSTNRDVCAAATRQRVRWAITGGRPFSWAGDRLADFVGMDRVGSSPGWTKVTKAGPYTLYKLTSCAK